MRYNSLNYKQKLEVCENYHDLFNSRKASAQDFDMTLFRKLNTINSRRKIMRNDYMVPNELFYNPDIREGGFINDESYNALVNLYDAMYSRKTVEARPEAALHKEWHSFTVEEMRYIADKIGSATEYDQKLLYKIIDSEVNEALFLCSRV